MLYGHILVELPKSFGEVKIPPQPGVITYFEGVQQVADPGRAGITTLQSLQANSNLAIADAQGRLVLVNPAVGKLGNLGQTWFEGPGRVSMDANRIKRVRMQETNELVFRLDAINVLNHANFGNPNVSINSTSFGRIALPTAGNRQFTFTLRVEF